MNVISRLLEEPKGQTESNAELRRRSRKSRKMSGSVIEHLCDQPSTSGLSGQRSGKKQTVRKSQIEYADRETSESTDIINLGKRMSELLSTSADVPAILEQPPTVCPDQSSTSSNLRLTRSPKKFATASQSPRSFQAKTAKQDCGKKLSALDISYKKARQRRHSDDNDPIIITRPKSTVIIFYCKNLKA